MKTLKVILYSSLLVLSSSLSFAQQWYLGLGGGYGFPVAGQSVASYSTAYAFTTQTLSYGKGDNYGAYGGYMFNKYIGAQLGVSYIAGGTTFTTAYSDLVGVTNYLYTTTQYGDMLRLIPAVRLQCGTDRLKPYVNIGFIAGIATTVTYGNSSFAGEYYKFSGGSSFGFHGALGFQFICSKVFALFAEAAVYYQNYAPAQETTPSGNIIDFVSSGNSGVQNQNTIQEPKVYLPFSSLGVNAGVQFSFVKQAAKAVAPAK
jgi:hypothetical protein